ncbi:heme oxygenase-like protein, multi-helical [Rhypophila decipiens]|uniref:Heme oxygenase-like protein, multi-helical n=1 Tax=Rhypophila decipiens TaxID=261697 RepID=A0AAN6XUU8_9PEZI|nr:heme oxygenase-like protein, multi-helical [Rhypophila decipiens]
MSTYFPITLGLCGIAILIWGLQRRKQSAHPLELPRDLKPVVPQASAQTTEDNELELYKRLYFKLHNLEDHHDVLSQSNDILISLLAKSLSWEQKRHGSILALDSFEPESLEAFVTRHDTHVASQWEQYTTKRKSGAGRELFQTKTEAHDWIKQKAPLKLVDGAWLGHVHRVNTPYNLRQVTKDAWQVMTEEYGDGQLEQHHVHLYSQLLQEVGFSLPPAHSADFTHPRHGMTDTRTWKSAVAQLLISLFPFDYLPEILGYNMHFELLQLETMMAARELEELNISSYYFFLHISIDNSHSGHTAMAVNTVAKYLRHIEVTEGPVAAQTAWRRIQAGYCLSRALSDPEFSSLASSGNEWDDRIIKILRAKVDAVGQIHCTSQIKIAGQRLSQWLVPENLASVQNQQKFLSVLAGMKPWVRAGNSANSRLIQELSWGGKMFGSFTSAEVDLVRRWIDNLANPSPQAYLGLLADSHVPTSLGCKKDIRLDYPVFSPRGEVVSANDIHMTDSHLDHLQLGPAPSQHHDAKVILARLLPLWLTHQCVMEGFMGVPSRTVDPSMAAATRVLRAYNGFIHIEEGVSGMDEARRTDETLGLVEMGLHMARQAGLPQPASLREALDMWPCEFSVTLLHLAMRPNLHRATLLGLASAFSELHEAVLRSKLLPPEDRETLRHIIWAERLAFKIFVEAERATEQGYSDYERGRELAQTAGNVSGLCRMIKALEL